MKRSTYIFLLLVMIMASFASTASAPFVMNNIAKPNGLNPANGDDSTTNSRLLSLTPKFTWGKPTGAKSFVMQVALDCTFAKIVLEAKPVTNTFTPSSNLPAGELLCWRVAAVDSVGKLSDWSTKNKFTTANPPSTPTLLAPKNNALTNDNSPKLDWQEVVVPSGTTFGYYQVQYSDKVTFNGTGYFRDVTVSGHTNSEYDIPDENTPPADKLPGARTYYWRVRAFNTKGEYGPWSAVRILKITPDRPTNLVVSPNPPINPTPLLDWDNVYSAEIYKIVIADNPSFVDPIYILHSKISKLQLLVDLPSGVTIYWRVYATDYDGYKTGLPSATGIFISANAPNKPTLITPKNGSLTNDRTPIFKWSSVLPTMPPGATFDHYEFKVSEYSNFKTLILQRNNLHGTKFTPAANMAKWKTYYWSVRACATDGACSSWAYPFSFRIQ